MRRNDKVWHVTVLGIFNILFISALDQRKNRNVLPRFLPTPNNITVNQGELAILQCSIENLGTKTVSWLKLPNKHPLTVGTFTFVEDPGITVEHVKHRNQWNLMIKNVNLNHSGVYECQISSTEKLTRLVQLTVEDGISKPVIYITGTEYVENTEAIKLVCNATSGGRPPEDITWFKDGEIINAGAATRIVITKFKHLVSRSLVSELTVDRSHLDDAGIYVCRTSDFEATEFKVHVLNTYDVVTVKKGEPIKLACNMTSGKRKSSPDISWYKDNVPLSTNSEEKIFITHYPVPSSRAILSVLTILESKFEDAGVYNCQRTTPFLVLRRYKLDVTPSDASTSTHFRKRGSPRKQTNGEKRSESNSYAEESVHLGNFAVLILAQVICWCLTISEA